MAHTISVKLRDSGKRTYPVRVESGLFDQMGTILSHEWAGRKVFIISDVNVSALYGRKLHQSLIQENMDAILLDIPSGESSKSVGIINTLYTQILSARVRRDSVVVALGGGVVGDVAGYVAATMLRGLAYVQIPTTVIAQVDSSVGGKVGIDHSMGKNLIGAFHHPTAVYIDPKLLRTLAIAEFRNGLAEVVKIAAALDPELFRRLETIGAKLHRGDDRLMGEIITKCIGLKAAVVYHDEREEGLRKSLNLGHTVGHALEYASGYEMKHGQAVAVGLAVESHIALNMGILRQQDYTRLLKLMKVLKLETRVPAMIQKKKFLEALQLDKKGSHLGNRFVLMKSLGRSVIGVPVPSPLILESVGLPQ